jgi:glycosyltransferase involved in cell wall biosynthesis
MRIAYITPYQGPTVVEQRPIVRNRSLSNKIKMELIATSLGALGHEVEIISQGEVVDPSFVFYPSLCETEPFHPDVPIHYASALPIQRLNGIWSNLETLRLFRMRHQRRPFDLVIIFNMKTPQVTCANYAMRHLGLPVILEYEDNVFTNVMGEAVNGFAARRYHRACKELLRTVAGGIAVSPHLLSQFPPEIPRLLLRGAVGDDMLQTNERSIGAKQNWVLFSGTHIESNGVAELINAWRTVGIPEWQLHITGYGGLTDELRQMAEGIQGIVFHGLVSRPELLRIMCSAKICINPHAVSKSPGNVFAFKIIEYLAAGAHVITTRMGPLEGELEAGITYMPDNRPETISKTLRDVVSGRRWEQNAARFARDAYGLAAVTKSLNALLQSVCNGATSHR